ncbi:MAG: bifunctional diaminohydroxyphosphoribosylaminopyrimidine deaminase/5-amino-6-(5-phosphoribosylamino)uracil reductase RibD [Candidatus Cloacimonetes bacterium]|nr:bifunctional diaminohydroxyphosphoribosylaminopyrimidine deaminase/5-amino-6-(5-phosphoribosylamino)uracil reductase RibD [Candidatus Cloacimonadota bacterium]
MGKLEEYFLKAYEVAESGRGKTSPNPFAGALIVKDNAIVGRGHTQSWGNDHAEIQAIKAAGKEAAGATMYVTLEPCCFQGRTPACTEAIINAGISRVVIGIIDPNPRVNGKGISALEEAGIEVKHGYMEKEIRQQLEYYLTWIEKQRPFVILKTAMTLDGFIAGADGNSKWITGAEARKRVHGLRQEVDAIITGIGTILADDPQLNCRLEGNESQPLRIIIDRDLRIPNESRIVTSAKSQKTIVFCSEGCEPQKMEQLQKAGIQLEVREREAISPQTILSYLYELHLNCVIVEAGNRLSSAFIRADMVDKYFIFIAPSLLGNGLKAFSLTENDNLSQRKKLRFDTIQYYGDDCLVIAYPQR